MIQKRFTALETAVLAALCERLPPDGVEILKRQLQLVRKTERQPPEHSEIRYRLGLLCDSDKSTRFPNQAVELKFARMRFKCPGLSGIWKAEFWLVSGRFFMIDFVPGIKRVQQVDQIEVSSFTILEDPMKSSTKPGGTPVIPVPHEIAVWCFPLSLGADFVSANAPVDVERKVSLLSMIDAKLPPEYLETTQWCNGWDTNLYSVMGLSDIYQVDLPSGMYYVIAVNPDGVLIVKDQSRDGEIYWAKYDGTDPQPMGSSFKSALKAFL